MENKTLSNKNVIVRFFFLMVPILAFFAISACEGDYRPVSIGGIDEVIVVMDTTNSETALAIEETFGKYVETLPGSESAYRLMFRDFTSNAELEELRRYKNIIIAGPIDEETNAST